MPIVLDPRTNIYQTLVTIYGTPNSGIKVITAHIQSLNCFGEPVDVGLFMLNILLYTNHSTIMNMTNEIVIATKL